MRLDLRRPLTRSDLGMKPGDGTFSRGAPAGQTLDVEVLLANGRELRIPAFRVNADTFGMPPNDNPPEDLVINRGVPDLAGAEQAVREAANVFGADQSAVDRYFEDQAAGGAADVFVTPAVQIGGVRAQVEVRSGDGPTPVVNYYFAWGDR